MISLTKMRDTENSLSGAPSKLCLGGGLIIVLKMMVSNRRQLKTREYR
jgi:hypothetical protein